MKRFCGYCSYYYYFICTGAVILEGPTNHTVPIGATVTFHCIAQGQDVFLEINNTAINYPADEAPFIEKGFTFSEDINYDTSTCLYL